MEEILLKSLPNLSIGIVSVLSLMTVVYWFMKHLAEDRKARIQRDIDLSDRFDKKEAEYRCLEVEIRGILMSHIQENTKAMQDNSNIHLRVIEHLKK